MNVEFRFNTGRLYTAAGQAIRVSYAPDTGHAMFADESRGIDGHVICDSGLTNRSEIARQVLSRYDGTMYTQSRDTLDYLKHRADVPEVCL